VNGRTEMHLVDGATRMDVTLHGAIAFNDDLTDVASLEDGGALTIRVWEGLVPRSIEITSSGGRISRAYFVGGLSRPWNDEAKQMLAQQLLMLVRRSGFGAEARVKSILSKKGVDGVLEEIKQVTGDYARRVYFTTLVDQAQLDPKAIARLLDQAGGSITSDYDRRIVLQKVASRVTLEEPATTAFVAVVDKMRSAYDRREALTTLLKKDGLSAETRNALLATTAGIPSDYDRRMVLVAYLDRNGVDNAVRRSFVAAVQAIHSDYDRRQVLTKLGEGGASADAQQIAFDLVGSMNSDYDRAEVLLSYLHGHGVSAATRPAFVAAAERIRSTYDQNRVLAALVKAESR